MSLRLLLPLGYMAALLLLSSIPGDLEPDNVIGKIFMWVEPAWQNLLHIPLYAGLAQSWLWALEHKLPVPHSRYLVALVLTCAWGVVDETYQLTVPGRYGSWTDMVLNSLGAVLAILYARWMTAKMESP